MFRPSALLTATLLCSCAAGPKASAPSGAADASPVPIADVARALVELGPYASFTLLLHPLAVPERGHLECQWREGKLTRYGFVDTGAPGEQWWRLKRPPNTVGLGEPDESTVVDHVRVTEGRVEPGTSADLKATRRVWHVSFLCTDGDLAAFSTGYYCGALCGRGFRVVLRRSGTGWLLAYSFSTWAA
jgi:hypothetical protein